MTASDDANTVRDEAAIIKDWLPKLGCTSTPWEIAKPGDADEAHRAVHRLVARVEQAERERDEALEDVKTLHHCCARYRVVIDGLEARVAQLTEWVDEAEDLLGRLATGNPFRGKGGTPDYWASEANDLLVGLADARAALDAARPADTKEEA